MFLSRGQRRSPAGSPSRRRLGSGAASVNQAHLVLEVEGMVEATADTATAETMRSVETSLPAAQGGHSWLERCLYGSMLLTAT
jgi:hypothetical protein